MVVALATTIIYLLASQRDTSQTSGELVADAAVPGSSGNRGSGARASTQLPKTPPALAPESHYVAEHDPTSDQYDPARFALSVGDANVPWSMEARVEPWATQREVSLSQWLAEHLQRVAPSAELKQVECKSRTCKVEVSVDAKQANSLLDRYPVFMLAPSTTVSAKEETAPTFYLMFPKTLLSAEQYSEYLKRTLQQLNVKGGSNG